MSHTFTTVILAAVSVINIGIIVLVAGGLLAIGMFTGGQSASSLGIGALAAAIVVVVPWVIYLLGARMAGGSKPAIQLVSTVLALVIALSPLIGYGVFAYYRNRSYQEYEIMEPPPGYFDESENAPTAEAEERDEE